MQVVNDTSYTTRLLNQPNDILNVALGYDYMGFSVRLSVLYQDNIFKRPDFWMQQRVNSAHVHALGSFGQAGASLAGYAALSQPDQYHRRE